MNTISQIRKNPRVDSIHLEDDGCYSTPSYWCYLSAGWRTSDEDSHVIHENKLKDVVDQIRCAREWLNDPMLFD